MKVKLWEWANIGLPLKWHFFKVLYLIFTVYFGSTLCFHVKKLCLRVFTIASNHKLSIPYCWVVSLAEMNNSAPSQRRITPSFAVWRFSVATSMPGEKVAASYSSLSSWLPIILLDSPKAIYKCRFTSHVYNK